MLTKVDESMTPWDEFWRRIGTPDRPGLGPTTRANRLLLADIEGPLQELFSLLEPNSGTKAFLKAAALLWHDHLEASHALSQGIESADGSFLHGIMHRREPDYGNAKYWFRRVGAHPAFKPLAQSASGLIGAADDDALRRKLLPSGAWDPFAFVDACAEALREPSRSGRIRLLEELQAVEFECLVRAAL
jgi:hypothetical protein